MPKKIAYKRIGKFGKSEYLIPLAYLHLLWKKETEKAICCGDYNGQTNKDGSPRIYIFGWIPKSQIIEINSEKYVPAWIVDNWGWSHLQFTDWINGDYRHESWEVKELPENEGGTK